MAIDFVLKSKKLFTGTSNESIDGALAVSQGKIVAVGESDDIISFSQEENTGASPYELIDYEDCFVMSGFHDSHVHFFHSALYSSPLAESFVGQNEEDCVAKMKAFSLRRPRGWLLSQGWREYLWDKPVLPSKHSLDKAFPDRPVALYSGDAHTLWLNSCALSRLGLHPQSVPPEGGSYDHDENGELTGIVREAAAMELMPKIVGAFSDNEIDTAYKGFLSTLAANGITSVCDLSLMAHPGLDFIRDDVYYRLLQKGELTARINMFPTLLDDVSRYETMKQKYSSPLLQVCGFKQFFDGVSSQHTAWLTDPYTNAHFKGDVGRPTVDPIVMRKFILKASRSDIPVRIHAIGDGAIHETLNIFEEARRKYGPLSRGRKNAMEHLENFLPEDIERMAKLDVVAAVQPPHITLDPGGPERDLGPERVPYMWPFRALLNKGATLAFGTDSPVVDVNSRDLLYTAITRKEAHTHLPEGGWLPEECVTPAEALIAYTLGSAYACGRAEELGTLEARKYADLVVLDTDLLNCTEDDIQKAQIEATYVNGEVVYKR